jgi:hypothetical protein
MDIGISNTIGVKSRLKERISVVMSSGGDGSNFPSPFNWGEMEEEGDGEPFNLEVSSLSCLD